MVTVGISKSIPFYGKNSIHLPCIPPVLPWFSMGYFLLPPHQVSVDRSVVVLTLSKISMSAYYGSRSVLKKELTFVEGLYTYAYYL